MESVRLIGASSNERTRGLDTWVPQRWLATAVGGLVAFAVLVSAALVAGRLAANRAVDNLVDQARAGLPLATATLAGEIEKQRLIPLTLARDPDVIALLETYDANAEANLDRKLKDIAEDAGST